MDGYQVVVAKPEEVLNLTVNGKEPLSLGDWFLRKAQMKATSLRSAESKNRRICL